MKHLAKLINTSSLLNTSPEKLLETQQLWQRLTVESQTVSVPVTPLPPAPVPVNPPTPLPPVNPTTVGSTEDAPLTMSYSVEGLTNPRMAFEDFAATAFFQQELEASKQRGAERKRVTEERGSPWSCTLLAVCAGSAISQ